jgi:ElaB/YqjD/DUF883 family membrane-anchored ribosome-binding protein
MLDIMGSRSSSYSTAKVDEVELAIAAGDVAEGIESFNKDVSDANVLSATMERIENTQVELIAGARTGDINVLAYGVESAAATLDMIGAPGDVLRRNFSLESAQYSPVAAFEAGIEGIGDMLSSMWEKMKELWASAVKGAKKIWVKILLMADGSKKALEKLEKKAGEMDGEVKDKSSLSKDHEKAIRERFGVYMKTNDDKLDSNDILSKCKNIAKKTDFKPVGEYFNKIYTDYGDGLGDILKTFSGGTEAMPIDSNTVAKATFKKFKGKSDFTTEEKEEINELKKYLDGLKEIKSKNMRAAKDWLDGLGKNYETQSTESVVKNTEDSGSTEQLHTVIVASYAGEYLKGIFFNVERNDDSTFKEIEIKYKSKKGKELSELSVDLMEFSDVKKFIANGIKVCETLNDKKDDMFKEYDDSEGIMSKVEKPANKLFKDLKTANKADKEISKTLNKAINSINSSFRKFTLSIPKFTLDKITGIMHTAKDMAWYANMTLSYYK